MPRLANFFLFNYVIKAPQQRLRAKSKESKPASKYSYTACMHVHILHNQRASSSSLVRGWGGGNFFDHLHFKSNLRFALWVAEIFNISATTLWRHAAGANASFTVGTPLKPYEYVLAAALRWHASCAQALVAAWRWSWRPLVPHCHITIISKWSRCLLLTYITRTIYTTTYLHQNQINPFY